MEGGGFGGFGFDPEMFQRALGDMAEQARQQQTVAFADSAIHLAVQMTVAAVGRMTPTHQARVRHVDFSTSVLVAGFLDGNACVFDLKLRGYTFNSGRLIVDVTFRQPPVGGGTCAKTSTSYVVVAFSRAQLGRLPTFVELRAFAHS